MKDIVNEDFDDIGDLKLGNVGKELDQPEKLKKGFDKESMFDQLGKILDSQDSVNKVTTVTTDDGDTVEVTPQQARTLRMMLTSDNIKPDAKLRFTRELQMSNTLHDFVDVKDYHEMPKIFMQKYM